MPSSYVMHRSAWRDCLKKAREVLTYGCRWPKTLRKTSPAPPSGACGVSFRCSYRLFRQSQKTYSRKFNVASVPPSSAASAQERLGGTILGSKRTYQVAFVAPLCIKGWRLVTLQLVSFLWAYAHNPYTRNMGIPIGPFGRSLSNPATP